MLGLGTEDGLFGPRDATRAASLYERGCDAGHVSACGTLGYAYFNGVGVARDRARAAEFLRRGCDGGDDTACALGARAACIERRETACAGATETLARLCERRVALACSMLATQLGEGFGVPQDLALSTTYAARACELGALRGCELVAMAQARGEGAPLDLSRAVSSLTELCARDETSETQSCSALGFLHHLGRGVAQDDARAASLYERACEHRDARGCALLGWSFEEGLHAPRDLARAAALYQRGCDETLLGAHLACVHLGNALVTGRGVAQHVARAVAAYERACELGEPVACQNLAEHLLSGEGIAPDAERARAMLHRACAGGGEKSCVLATLLDVVPVLFAGARATSMVNRAPSARRSCAGSVAPHDTTPTDLFRHAREPR